MNKLHIRVDVEYELNGETLDSMKELADRAIQTLFGNGSFTGETPAEIKCWRCIIKPPRDKHIALTVNQQDGLKVYGAFDGYYAALAAKPKEGDWIVTKLEEPTTKMKEAAYGIPNRGQSDNPTT